MLDQRRRNIRVALDRRFHEVSTIILSRQNPATGLIPASVAVTTHGDYTHAWTRDNVYSILAVWGLALAYRRIDDDEGRTYELENATIKCMRGLLFAMMRQAHKVELFKNTQTLEHSLHAKYNTANGDVVVGDREWGHLQIDATSIFLLALAQMTASGLLIIYTKDEVDFIQNLVFYIERAYRTPDYGIWERGNKLNHGQPELNSSSIGMAVAALQAINGLNLFGARGGPSSVIHVLPDELTRNYTTLHSALPRESYSKEIDAALLSVISFPGFAVSDPKLIAKTRSEMVKKLGGKYGFKRFLRDGHQTVLEDTSRLHYDSHELKIFEHIECEWPLFFTYMILDGLFRDDPNQVEEYSQLLEPLLVDSGTLSRFSVAEDYDHTQKLHKDNNRRRSSSRRRSIAAPSSPRPNRIALVPELYIVPRDYTNQEKADPGSVQRYPNENIPLVWAQSLYILGSLIKEDLLSPAELDPLGRRFLPNRPKQASEVVVQMVLLAESAQLRDQLAAYGLETQTVDMCAPITVSTASALRDAYLSLGKNAKLGLSGRPKRPMGTLSTSKIYRCQGQLYAFLPHFTNKEEFYLVSDYNYLISIFEQELTFVKNHWWYTGRPTMVVMLTKEMFGEARGSKEITGPSRWRFNNGSNSKRNLLNFLMSLRTGTCAGVKVRVGKLADMIGLASIESLDFLISTKNMDEAEEWRQTLKGDVGPHDHERLHYSQRPQRGRSARRKSSADGSHRKSRSPLKSPYYTEDPTKYEQFKLRDHVDDDDMAALDLGPPVATPAVGAAAGAVPLSPVDAAAAAAAAIPPATPLRFIESRPGTPTLRTASPRRGSSSKMRATLTETTMNPDAVGGGAALSRRNSYVFDVNDGAPQKAAAAAAARQSGLSISTTADAATAAARGAGGFVDSPVDVSTDSFGSNAEYSMEMLTLTLSDPSSLEPAMVLLKSSTNIHDQMDLLQYLYSCIGFEGEVPELGTVRSLIEEVYIKAMPLKQWSIVRQAAGLLRKNVNSLTINVGDLLIRGKPVTISFGPQEYFITDPLAPEILSELIYKHCASDVREPPLVQEILTYLGSLVRATPQLFDGIQRVRTYFFIIAMREEISRMRGCDEEESVEFMMQLSPFELKSLLTAVLSTRDQTSTADSLMGLSTSYRWRNIQLQGVSASQATNTLKFSMSGIPLPSQLNVTAQSAGFGAGNFAKIELYRDNVMTSMHSVFGRGLNVVILDPLDGAIIETASFDTHISVEESNEFANMIEWLEPGMIVIIVAKDDCAESLNDAARAACASIGSSLIRAVSHRDSWCIIGEKGAEPGSVPEAHQSSGRGPTEPQIKSFDLAARRKRLLAALPSSKGPTRLLSSGATVNLVMPSHGRWLRRRKNDGALNRVPSGFYPQVWRVLSRCHGILVGKQFLPRDPTVSEKTPEEFNFALQVESHLDAVRDPAERQIAFECLTVIARIAARHPDAAITSGTVDVLRVIRDAVGQFWTHWRARHSPADLAAASAVIFGSAAAPSAAGAQPSDLSFEANEGMARRLFFDLAPDGPDGTMAYLARSSAALCFSAGALGADAAEMEDLFRS